ncbi:MAG: hypothetical protein ACRCWT_11295 [Aeromonas veronii]
MTTKGGSRLTGAPLAIWPSPIKKGKPGRVAQEQLAAAAIKLSSR